jgi:aryl-phospho-beta-D-glucosidase BglC (GH1 family)/regulation of enolase protein 1 (concanavalin A-like superfamily)
MSAFPALLALALSSLGGGLPDGWSGADVGSPAQAGSADLAAGTWSVSGGGGDIWNGSDDFHLVSRALRGDGAVVARVDAIGNSAQWAKAGVMLRASSGASAAFADVVVTPSNGLAFQWRSAGGAFAEAIYAGGTVRTPVWVRVERRGELLAGSFSHDGEHWVQVGEPTAVDLGPQARAGLAVSAGTPFGLNSSTFSRVAVLPSGWRDHEIGSPPAAGRADHDGSRIRVSGSGEVFNGWDQFHLSGRTHVGDVDVAVRVDAMAGGGAYAKAGVMIREAASPDAAYAFSFVNRDTGAPAQGANFEFRDARGSTSQNAGLAPGVAAPSWVRLVRRGDEVTAYHSADGRRWVQNGPVVEVPMGPTVWVGLAVSGGGGTTCAADFTRLRVAAPGWGGGDLGAPSLAGSARWDGLRWQVAGGGDGVLGTSDSLHLVRRRWSGDVELVARVDSLTDTDPLAGAGLMIREGSAPDAPCVHLSLTPPSLHPFAGAVLRYRDDAGAPVQTPGLLPGAVAPGWIKLTREDDTFRAFHSADGVQWTWFGSATVPMDPAVHVGLAVSARDDGALNTAEFSGVYVGRRHRTPFLRASGIEFKDHRGTGDAVRLRGTNAGGWLLHEQWLGGMDSSGLPDDLSIRTTLESRFGEAWANRIMGAWEDHWFTEADLDRIQALGLNVLRVPFSYRCVFDSSWGWRSDAFTHLDWVVEESARRGIHVILDLHGTPGGASPWQSSGIEGGGALWTNSFYRDRSVELWGRIAEHFAGHPYVAAYDLINEPVPPSHAAMWSLYDRMYDAVRAVDPHHVVMMEGGGGAGVGGTYWTLDTLPSPSSQGWSNVAYQTHAYALNGGPAAEGTAQSQVDQLGLHGVPVLVGEFNLGDRQAFGVQLWDDNGLHWTSWTHKVRHGLGSEWGIYGVTQWPTDTNLQSDSPWSILAALETVATPGRFGLNPELRDLFGTPWLKDDLFQTQPSTPIYVGPATSVLSNDTVPNGGQPGIQARAFPVSDPEHGTLTLFEDGTLYYVPDPGHVGADAFRYLVRDGVHDSANPATVTILTESLAAPWATGDVGGPGVLGRTELDPDEERWSLHGSGTGLRTAADRFQFARRAVVGDAGVMARLTSLDDPGGAAEAGVMLRDAAAPGSAFAAVTADASGLQLLARTAPGSAVTVLGGAPHPLPVWLRLRRSGDTVTGEWSEDREQWNALGTLHVPLSPTPLAGLAVSSGDDGALARADLSDARVSPPPPTGLAAEATDAQVRLTWEASEGASHYQVWRATAGAPLAAIATVPGPTFVDTGLTNGTLYRYALSAANLAGESSTGAEVSARPLAVAGGVGGLPSTVKRWR